MTTLLIVAVLIFGVIASNIVAQFIPKIPKAFILILVGIGLSFIDNFNNFELEPEFFMLMIIAPLMFIDGQKQSFSKIRKHFSGIVLLSVTLAVVTAVAVGFLTNAIEALWTFPIALALASIVTPTDAVAVKSMTQNTEMPEKVSQALELESLFNDATGLVLLDLALSMFAKGSFSAIQGIEHFLFVAVGGIAVGVIAGLVIVSIRVNVNLRAFDAEKIILPISLVTPFVVYILAEQVHVSGILAVVATGIVHNWEQQRLRLTATNVQLTSRAVWSIFSDMLNDIVFLILGLSLISVFREIQKAGLATFLGLVLVSIIIYFFMFVVRFVWAAMANNDAVAFFFGKRTDPQHRFYARTFAISGVHGAVTLAMAFSLPETINGHEFPFREEVIIIATLVIFLSLIVSSIVLPRMLPEKKTDYSEAEIANVRNEMVDFATVQVRNTIDDRNVREELTEQLLSQKGLPVDRDSTMADYKLLMLDTKKQLYDFVQSPEIAAQYSSDAIAIFEKMIDRISADGKNGPNQDLRRVISRYYRTLNRRIKLTRSKYGSHKKTYQRRVAQAKKSPKLAKIRATHAEVLNLIDAVSNHTDDYLDGVLVAHLKDKNGSNEHINLVRRMMNGYLQRAKRNYSPNHVQVDSEFYIQAFQYEYNFVQRELANHRIQPSVAHELYSEINQAQMLQLQQLEEFEVDE
ncbi:cation:proton antiporter [Lactococcus insecticola]|uniref:Na+/H+ antiporter n=1 Tax=Pseudolactococcus insecticola TaxID=2709158 RepID=A0A6A0B6P5_9LACT|nr:sodium:proton antiporter [Lactococcus insecticola]GFH41109.1 Na+/H+ antiporter [Lactococcus insecticola]